MPRLILGSVALASVLALVSWLSPSGFVRLEEQRDAHRRIRAESALIAQDIKAIEDELKTLGPGGSPKVTEQNAYRSLHLVWPDRDVVHTFQKVDPPR